MSRRRTLTLRSCSVVCALGLFAQSSCTEPVQRPQSHVNVVIEADRVVRNDTVRVEVEIETQTESGAGWQNEARRTFRPDPTEIRWPIEFTLPLRRDLTVPSYNLVALAFDERDAVVGRVQAIRDPKRALKTGLDVRFETACYRQPKLCGDGYSCSAGDCVNARDDQQPMAVGEPDATAPTNTGKTENAATADPNSGLAKAGEPCRVDSRACPDHAAQSALECQDGTWHAGTTCADDERCDSAAGPMQGTCRPMARECLNQKPNVAFCDSDSMRVCTDLVSSEIRACAENQHCVPGTSEAKCDCSPGFVADGAQCRVATSCGEDRGGCDPLTDCSVVQNTRVCSACPSDYTGTGEAGCVPLLRTLSAGGLTITPELSPDTFAYRIHAPLVAPTVTLMAAGPDDTHVAVDAVAVLPGEGWTSPLLPLKETTVTLTLTSGAGVSRSYQITIERTGMQAAYLKANNTGDGDNLGTSVAMSGDTLVSGAAYEDSAATGVGGSGSSNALSNSGAVYVFRRGDKGWGQEAYVKASDSEANDLFGTSVGLDGDTLSVGAIRAEFSETYQSDVRSGVAYVFTRVNGLWSERQKLVPSKAVAGDLFGLAHALEGDTLAIGAMGAAAPSGERSGVVYIFERTGDVWKETQILAPSQPAGVAGFGSTVALSGDRLLTGAPYDSPRRKGAAFVFVRRDGRWVEEQRLIPEAVTDGSTFGFRVGIHGHRLAVGAPRVTVQAPPLNPSTPPGETYVYELAGDTWQQTALLRGPSPDTSDAFGSCVAVSDSAIVVGANLENGSARGLGGDPSRRGSSLSGAAFIYAKVGAKWVFSDYLKASNASTNDSFGWGLALTNDVLLVAAPYEGSNATGVDGASSGVSVASGALYVFQ